MPNKTNETNKNNNKNRATPRITRSTFASRATNEHKPNDINNPISTNKRKANQTSPTNSPEAKTTTHSKMSNPVTLADIQSRFGKQTATIKEEIKSEIKIMSDELKASFHGEISKLHERVDAIETNVASQLSSVRSDIDSCVNRLNSTNDDLARIGELNKLKINGIAHINNENLKDIFCSIAKLIGYDITNPLNMPEIVRMQKRSNQTHDFIPLSSIIVKFVATHIRNSFYGLYLAKATKEPILTEHFRLPQGGTVRIGKMLTPHNQLIFTEALKLKRDKKLLKVNTSDGLVRVKTMQSERFAPIKSKRELEIYIASRSKASPSELNGTPTSSMNAKTVSTSSIITTKSTSTPNTTKTTTTPTAKTPTAME